MFAFFNALFGGAYLGGKYTSDKNNKVKAEQRWNKYKKIENEITNSSFEDKHKRILEQSSDTRFEMLNEIADDLNDIFGMEWASMFASYKFPTYQPFSSRMDGFNNIWNLAFHIWMSKHGYIPLSIHSYNTHFELNGCDSKKRVVVASKACRAIESHMQKTHPGIELRLWNDTEHSSGNPRLTWEHWIHSYDGELTTKPW